jgi:hypothetical protein
MGSEDAQLSVQPGTVGEADRRIEGHGGLLWWSNISGDANGQVLSLSSDKRRIMKTIHWSTTYLNYAAIGLSTSTPPPIKGRPRGKTQRETRLGCPLARQTSPRPRYAAYGHLYCRARQIHGMEKQG